VPDSPMPAIPKPVGDLIDVLRTMLIVNSRDEKWLRKDRQVTIQYEFAEEEGDFPYHCRLAGAAWTFEPGSLPDEECDIIMLTSAESLSRILHGQLGGREAITSGKMNLRKAPPMPTLLLLRAMFNRYTKAEARGTLP